MSKIEKIIYFFLTSVWFIYLAFRIFYVPVIYDEAMTYFLYIHTGEILPYHSYMDANNHFLNSLLTLCSAKLLGVSVWSIRLPNLVFSIIFVFFVFKISSSFKHILSRWGYILTLFSSLFLCEFFGYCRGYGMSIALLMGMIWFLFQYIKTKNISSFFLSLMLMILAISANLNFVSTGIIFIFITVLFFIFSVPVQVKMPGFWLMIVLFIIGAFSLMFFVHYGFLLQGNGKLYLGGSLSFYNGTIMSLVRALEPSSGKVIYIILDIIFGLSIAVGLFKMFSSRFTEFFSPVIIMFLFLTGNIMATLVLGWVFHVNFPQDRTVLQWFVLFIIYIFLLADSFSYLLMRFLRPVMLLIPFYFIIHSIPYYNIRSSYNFNSECFPNDFFDQLHLKKNNAGYPVSTNASVFLTPGYMFRNLLTGGNDEGLLYQEFPSYCADYQVLDVSKYPQSLIKYDRIGYDNATRLNLLKRKIPLTPIYFSGRSGINTGGITTTETVLLCDMKPDSLFLNPVYVGFDLTLTSSITPFRAGMVVDVTDSAGSHLFYEKLDFDLYRNIYSRTHFRNGLLIPNIPQNAARIKIFLWNNNLLPFLMENASCEIYKMQEL